MKIQRNQLPFLLLGEISLRLEFLLRDRRGHRESYSKAHSIFLKEVFLPMNYFGSICIVWDPISFPFQMILEKLCGTMWLRRITDLHTTTQSPSWLAGFSFGMVNSAIGVRRRSIPALRSSALLSLQWECCIFISLRFNAVVPTK